MRVLLLGMGSRGDVQPLVALGERPRLVDEHLTRGRLSSPGTRAPRRPVGGAGCSGSAQLGEDRVDVLLDRRGREVRACSIPALVRPRAISRRTSSSRAVRATSGTRRDLPSPAHERVDDRRVDDGAARADLAQGVDEILEVADAVLEEVAEPGRPGRRRVRCAYESSVCCESTTTPVPGCVGADRVRRLDALHAVARRHPDVGEDASGRQPATASSSSGADPTQASTATSPESSSRRRSPSRTR